MLSRRVFAVIALIAAAAASRLLPHPPNVTPIAAMALFGGAYLESRIGSLLVPLSALLLSDLVLGIYPGIALVYSAMLVTVALGWALRTKRTPVRIAGATLASSVSFFVITNIGVWMASPLYPKNITGLVECYTAAIPFFRNSLVGDGLFATLLFGGFWLARLYWRRLAEDEAVLPEAI